MSIANSRFGQLTALRLAVLATVCSGAAQAEFRFVPYVSGQYEYDSNVFEVSNDAEAIEQRGSDEQADTVLRSAVGAELSYLLGQQRLQISGEGRRIDYDRFGQLSHNEHTLQAGYHGKLMSVADGFVQYRQDRLTASFSDLDTDQLSVQTERSLDALAGLNVTPGWRLEVGGSLHNSKLPLPDAPNFELEETTGNAAIKYIGASKLSAGLYGEYQDGEYSGRNERSEPFEEVSVQLTLDYSITGTSSLGFKAGATERRDKSPDDGNPDNGTEGGTVSGFTGSLGYNRLLTGKTSMNAQVFRRIDSFEAGANALIETGALASVSWQPTIKVGLAARAGYTNSQFDNGSSIGASIDREDDFLTASVEATYQALRWLSFKPFVNFRDRDSNITDAQYDATVVGLLVRLSLGGDYVAPGAAGL